MTAAPEAARRSAVISAAGAERVAETLATTDNLRVATELLFELGQSRIEIAVECQSRFSTPTPLLEAVQRATIEQVADLVVTAHSIDPNLAQVYRSNTWRSGRTSFSYVLLCPPGHSG